MPLNSDTDAHFSCTLEIADDLTITLTEDGADEASGFGYTPTIRIYG